MDIYYQGQERIKLLLYAIYDFDNKKKTWRDIGGRKVKNITFEYISERGDWVCGNFEKIRYEKKERIAEMLSGGELQVRKYLKERK